ncbi:MAG TPA: ABC transporter permease [Longimicrobiales bacterium]|nr:ABC transporter permease [Longimicrobiales bacterium]
MKLRALDRKMVRDLWGMRGQALAIAFVITAGIATYVSMRSVMESLQRTLDDYYADYRFADGFASVRRAPESLAERLRRIPGIAHVRTRVTAGANLEVETFDEPVTGMIVSLPGGQPALNRLYVREGRLPRSGRDAEVVLNETFAEAHDLDVGDAITAIINGRRELLVIVGIALSPEFLMQIQPGALFPDPQRFGVMWMDRATLAPAFDMDGAFNTVAFTLAPGARSDAVIERVDDLLRPYGGQGAYGREDQASHALITEEFRGLRSMATMLPIIFLGVAAFLLNIVVTRLIALQREQIAALKAFGYGNVAVGLHYLKLVLAIALVGTVGGIIAGAWAGGALGEIYLTYYRFPALHYAVRPHLIVTAVTLTTGAAVLGVLRAVRRAVRLAPAEAMRPAPPASYRPTFVERLGLKHLFDQPTRMILRNLERQPLKSLLTVIGISSACALLIMGVFFTDAFDRIVDVQYGIAQREDMTVTFIEPTSTAAVHELASLRGVQHAEPFRMVPVRLRHGHRTHETAIEGVQQESQLRRIIDTELEPIAVPPAGIILAERLGAILDAVPGDRISVEVLEGTRRTRDVTVAGLTRQYVGMGAFMDMSALNRLAGGGQAVSGAFLMADERYTDEISRRLRERPRVAAIATQESVVNAFLETSAASMLAFTFVLSLFAAVIAFGVIYNSARISLSERDRELASLRVLGFTRGEVAYILLGELAVLVLLAIPVGFAVGSLASAGLVRQVATDMYRIPLVLSRGTFGLAAAIVLASGLASALIVLRRLNRLDLVGVLKTRE